MKKFIVIFAIYALVVFPISSSLFYACLKTIGERDITYE